MLRWIIFFGAAGFCRGVCMWSRVFFLLFSVFCFAFWSCTDQKGEHARGVCFWNGGREIAEGRAVVEHRCGWGMACAFDGLCEWVESSFACVCVCEVDKPFGLGFFFSFLSFSLLTSGFVFRKNCNGALLFLDVYIFWLYNCCCCCCFFFNLCCAGYHIVGTPCARILLRDEGEEERFVSSAEGNWWIGQVWV